jgi:DNA-binding transcriptional ArsR family regulator
MYFTSMLINESIKYDTTDSLSKVFLALGDPTRRAILESLSQGEATVNELARPFVLSLPAISRHLKVLERAGLISRGRNAQWRPCRLELESFKEGAEYMNRYRELWETSLGSLQEYLLKLQAQPTKK